MYPFLLRPPKNHMPIHTPPPPIPRLPPPRAHARLGRRDLAPDWTVDTYRAWGWEWGSDRKRCVRRCRPINDNPPPSA
jgi:hypothetical protein